MPRKVTIELTEAQARIVLRAVEEWFRLRMGQCGDLANDLAFYGHEGDKDAFDQAILKREVLEDVIRGMFHIAFPPHRSPKEVEPDARIASDIWSVLRYELSEKADWMPTPFQMGEEPLPKITVMEVKKNAAD